MKKTILLLAVITLLTSFNTLNNKSVNFTKHQLPGVIQLDSNLFLDAQEINVLSWKEFQYWNKRVFGEESEMYLSTMIDTGIWDSVDSNFMFMKESYMNHNWNSNLPIIGINIDQAKAYSSWRSDRVFELLLIKEKIIQPNANQNSTNYFSIDRFYADKNYSGYHNLQYPSYELVSIDNWEEIYGLAEKHNSKHKKKCKNDKVKVGNNSVNDDACSHLIKGNQMVINYSQKSPHPKMGYRFPIYDVSCDKCKSELFFHLYGNVSELTKEGEYTIGGSWIDSKEEILIKSPKKYSNPTSWIGFRNRCSWKYYPTKNKNQ